MLIRDVHNPILKAHPELTWCSKKVYNCAVYKDQSRYLMLFRAIGDDWISRLGLAESLDGVNFTIAPFPVMSPQYQWESSGCEDPRLVKFDDTYYVTYTAFNGQVAQASMASSKDLRNWDHRRRLFPHLTRPQRENLPANWSKAAALFPEKINDTSYLLFGDNHIWAAHYTETIGWVPLPQPVLSARAGYFDAAYIEMGPPPILTSRGWLVLYHGIDRFDNQRSYSLGAALLAKDDPMQVIWRSSAPILAPTEPYEVMGLIDIVDGGFKTLKTLNHSDIEQLAADHKLPRAIFCCSALLEDNVVRLYYSGGDTVICSATVDLDTIFVS